MARLKNNIQCKQSQNYKTERKKDNNIQLWPSVQGNIQICQPEGEPPPPRVYKSGCFPAQSAIRNCFILFLPLFYRLSPLWGEIGLFGGEQQGCFQAAHIFANVLYVFSLVGEHWVVRRGTIGLFPGIANFGKTSQLFYYHMTNLIPSKS